MREFFLPVFSLGDQSLRSRKADFPIIRLAVIFGSTIDVLPSLAVYELRVSITEDNRGPGETVPILRVWSIFVVDAGVNFQPVHDCEDS